MQAQNITRHRARWSTSEINSLHNEYELKKYSVQEIANRHKRSVYSILYKLAEEQLIEKSWENVRGWTPSETETVKETSSVKNSISIIDYDDEDDDDDVPEDDPDDEDYVPEDEDEDDEEYEETDEISVMKEQISKLQKEMSKMSKILVSLQKKGPRL
jgi:DNA-binding PadR family transcriptional regulator